MPCGQKEHRDNIQIQAGHISPKSDHAPQTEARKPLVAGREIADCFRANNTRFLVTRPLRGAKLAIAHLQHIYDDSTNPVILPPDEAFLLVLYLIDVEHRDLLPDQSTAPATRYPQGSICLVSLERGAAISIRGKFDAIVFHFPHQHLTELAEKAGEPRVDDLAICRGIYDQTIAALGAAILPLLHASDGIQSQALQHIGLAFTAHLAHRYGRMRCLN